MIHNNDDTSGNVILVKMFQSLHIISGNGKQSRQKGSGHGNTKHIQTGLGHAKHMQTGHGNMKGKHKMAYKLKLLG